MLGDFELKIRGKFALLYLKIFFMLPRKLETQGKDK